MHDGGAVRGLLLVLTMMACTPPATSTTPADPDDTGDPSTIDTEPTGSATTDPSAFTVDVELASDVDGGAPTTVGIVTWSTTEGSVEDAFIRFGPDTDYGMVAPVDLTATDYRTLLLGMKPASTYHFEVVATIDGQQVLSGDHTVTTGAAFSGATFSVTREEGSEPGFVLLTAWAGGPGGGNGTSPGTTFIVDADGDIVWWHTSGVDNANVGRLSADRQSMWFTGATGRGSSGLRRVSMDTLDQDIYDVPATHDVVALGGDCMGILYVANPEEVHDICSGDTDSTLVADIAGQGGTGSHYNSIRYNEAQNVLVVSDHQDDVYAVDRASGDLLWTLGDITGSLSPHHGLDLLDDTLLVFANNGATNGSAVLEIDLEDGSEVMRYEPGVSVSNLGDVQRLPGGNTFIVLSAQTTTDTVREIDSDGNVVMTMSGIRAGYGRWLDSLYAIP